MSTPTLLVDFGGQQKPGCLPDGYTDESWLTPEQTVIWQQLPSLRWFMAHRDQLPGVRSHGRVVRVHVGTFKLGKTKG